MYESGLGVVLASFVIVAGTDFHGLVETKKTGIPEQLGIFLDTPRNVGSNLDFNLSPKLARG